MLHPEHWCHSDCAEKKRDNQHHTFAPSPRFSWKNLHRCCIPLVNTNKHFNSDCKHLHFAWLKLRIIHLRTIVVKSDLLFSVPLFWNSLYTSMHSIFITMTSVLPAQSGSVLDSDSCGSGPQFDGMSPDSPMSTESLTSSSLLKLWLSLRMPASLERGLVQFSATTCHMISINFKDLTKHLYSTLKICSETSTLQGAYNSGKKGKLKKFYIYSGNFCKCDCGHWVLCLTVSNSSIDDWVAQRLAWVEPVTMLLKWNILYFCK